MPLTVGGGVRSVEDARALLLAGADKVAVNSAAVARPEVVGEMARQFGDQCVVRALAARAVRPGRWEVFTHGGRRPTGISSVEHDVRHTSIYRKRVLEGESVAVRGDISGRRNSKK